MSHQPRRPPSIHLLKEEAKPAIGLGVDLAAINGKPLRNSCLHLRYGTQRIRGNVAGDPVAPVHDEGALVHAGLRGGNEIRVVHAAGPGCVYVCVGVEYGGKVLPLAGIAKHVSTDEVWEKAKGLTGNKASLQRVRGALRALRPDCLGRCCEWRARA